MGAAPFDTKNMDRIADWPAWHLWLTPASIGSTTEETEAAARAEVSAERIAEIEANSRAAFLALRDAPTASESIQ